MRRNVNLDLLRTVLMFFIVVFHSIIHGMIVTDTNIPTDMLSWSGELRVFVLQTILYMTSVSVNCFVLISGYFMVNKSLKFSRLTSIWLAALFYCLVLGVVGAWDGYYSIEVFTLIEQLLPVQFDNYWFITQYMGLMLLSPFLNKTIAALNQRTYQLLLLVMGFLTLSLFQSGDAAFPYGFQYKVNGGFSLIWFVYVYFVGAYIRCYPPFKNYKHFGRLFVIGSMVFAAVVNVVALLEGLINGNSYLLGELTYNGPTFILSCLLFLWALNLRSKSRVPGWLARFAPFVFGVYLFHDNFFMRDKIWHQWLHLNTIDSLPQLLLVLLGVSLAVFFTGLTVEVCRQKFFRLLDIDRHFASGVEWLVNQLRARCRRLLGQ